MSNYIIYIKDSVVSEKAIVTFDAFTTSSFETVYADAATARTAAHEVARQRSATTHDKSNCEDYTRTAPRVVTVYKNGIAGQAWANNIDADGIGSDWEWKPL